MVAYSPDPQPHRVKPNGPGQHGRDEQMSALGSKRTLRGSKIWSGAYLISQN